MLLFFSSILLIYLSILLIYLSILLIYLSILLIYLSVLLIYKFQLLISTRVLYSYVYPPPTPLFIYSFVLHLYWSNPSLYQGRLCIEKSKLGYGRTWILNTSSQFRFGLILVVKLNFFLCEMISQNAPIGFMWTKEKRGRG